MKLIHKKSLDTPMNKDSGMMTPKDLIKQQIGRMEHKLQNLSPLDQRTKKGRVLMQKIDVAKRYMNKQDK